MIRTATLQDLETIRSLNEAALPHVNSIPIADFEEFLQMTKHFVVIEMENEIAGFLITLDEKQSYDSVNYQFFLDQYDSFEYVDRIVIGDAFKGRGCGKALYQFLFENTEYPRVTCEVNIEPPNDASMKFHEKMGFYEVGQHRSEGGTKLVSLKCKDID